MYKLNYFVQCGLQKSAVIYHKTRLKSGSRKIDSLLPLTKKSLLFKTGPEKYL